MTTGQSRLIIAVIAIAVVVLLVIGTRRYTGRSGPREEGISTSRPGTQPPPLPPATSRRAARRPPAPATVSRPAPRVPEQADRPVGEAERAAATAKLNQGLKVFGDDDLLAARAALADALNTGGLSDPQAETARAKLAELAQHTLFGRRVIEGDPCTFWYKCQPGDVLGRVERKLELRVPAQLILLVNGIPDAAKIRAGQTLKMIRGPFHALVSKGRFFLDVYLEEPKTQRMIFVRRFRVGTGKDGSTPLGRWRVPVGRKMMHAPWTPPLSSDLPQQKILWGQPGYPLGKKGYWIALEGIEGNPHTAEDGYGIHGTNDRSSIGKAYSMGCIRLTDEDIELVFAMLYEKWSTVTVTP